MRNAECGAPSSNGEQTPNAKLVFVRLDWLALGGFALLTILFYAPLLLGLRTFPDGDFTHHFLPFSLFQQQALLARQLPLWDPYTYSGHPFLADTQAAVFYPLSNLVLGLTLPWTSPAARLYFLQVEAALHVALAGFFVYLLVRDLTGNRSASFLAGCCFAFSGYLTSYPPLQLAVLRTAIWLPLILWLLWLGFQKPSYWRWWIGVALAYTCAFLAGHPQTFLHLSYTVAAWVIFLLIQALRQGRKAELGHFIMGLLAFGLLALGLSAAQLWPSWEFAQLSVRANVDYAFVSDGFPLHDTWQLILPGVLTQFSPLYIGVIGLGLALVNVGGRGQGARGRGQRAEVRGQKSEDRGQRTEEIRHSPLATRLFFLALVILALLLSYGRHAFLYPLFYALAPGWKLFRGQERAAFLVALGLSVLAGYGVALLPTLSWRARGRVAILYAVLVAAAVYAFGLLWQFVGHSAIGQGAYLVIALVTLLLAMALVVALRWQGWSQRRLWLIIGLAVLNLFWANFTTNLDQFGPARKTILAPEMEAVQQAVANTATANLGLPGRVYNEFRIYEDYGVRQQIEDVWGSSPLRLARYAKLFDNFPLDRMWQLTGVNYVLTWRRELFGPSTLLAQFPQTKDTTYLHRLPAANLRAWFVQRIQPAPDDFSLKLLADHNFVLTKTALIAEGIDNDVILDLPASHNNIKLTRLAADQLHVDVDSEKGGFLTLSENWMPGWQVRNVECGMRNAECKRLPIFSLKPFTIYRTDLTFLGVPVPAGQTSFDLVYWPNSVRYGLWISGLTTVLLVVACLWRTARLRQR
ncbi:MAG: hypothetical protein U0350_16495 [Caldilineaceae bacterium]